MLTQAGPLTSIYYQGSPAVPELPQLTLTAYCISSQQFSANIISAQHNLIADGMTSQLDLLRLTPLNT